MVRRNRVDGDVLGDGDGDVEGSGSEGEVGGRDGFGFRVGWRRGLPQCVTTPLASFSHSLPPPDPFISSSPV